MAATPMSDDQIAAIIPPKLLSNLRDMWGDVVVYLLPSDEDGARIGFDLGAGRRWVPMSANRLSEAECLSNYWAAQRPA